MLKRVVHPIPRFSTCQFYEGEPRNSPPCGAATINGHQYCEEHRAICFRINEPKGEGMTLPRLTATVSGRF